MYTWCSKEYWRSDEFDFDYLEQEVGLFQTETEAEYDAKAHGCEDIVILQI